MFYHASVYIDTGPSCNELTLASILNSIKQKKQSDSYIIFTKTATKLTACMYFIFTGVYMAYSFASPYY